MQRAQQESFQNYAASHFYNDETLYKKLQRDRLDFIP